MAAWDMEQVSRVLASAARGQGACWKSLVAALPTSLLVAGVAVVARALREVAAGEMAASVVSGVVAATEAVCRVAFSKTSSKMVR